MKKVITILGIGLFAGVLDLIPLIFAKVPMFNLVAIMAFWLSATFFITQTKLFKNSVLNGLTVSLILMIPMALTVAATNPKDFVPMMSMAILLGPIVGFLTGKFAR